VIREGAPADVAILDIRDVKDKTFTDNYGNSISGNKLFVPLMTVKGGRTAYRQIFF
jgi:dihydroorotase